MKELTNLNGEQIMTGNQLAFKLFSVLRKPGQNIFFSPLSIEMALCMLYNGASGKNKAEMEILLGIQDSNLSVINSANAELIRQLNIEGSKAQMNIANSLWTNELVSINPSFIDILAASYSAEVFNTLHPDAINAWVKEKTFGMIPKIIDSIDSQTLLAIVNAIYFRGSWVKPFSVLNTKNLSFTLSNGSEKILPMMFQSGKYQYTEGENYRAIALPYSKCETSMVVILPDIGQDPANVAVTNWADVMQQFASPRARMREGRILLPKFKCEYEETLNDALIALGMQSAFISNKNCFDGIASNLYLSLVKHKAGIEVNEEGTAAYAATIAVVAKSLSANMPFQMVVDHPFFVAIVDNSTKKILFMGTIEDPQ
ncbi:MAG: serpin family protein [Ignavibacteriales bacterium]